MVVQKANTGVIEFNDDEKSMPLCLTMTKKYATMFKSNKKISNEKL